MALPAEPKGIESVQLAQPPSPCLSLLQEARRENKGISAFQTAAARLRPDGLAGQGWCQSCRGASQSRLKKICPTQNTENGDQAKRPELQQTTGTDDGCSYDCLKTDVSGSRRVQFLIQRLELQQVRSQVWTIFSVE